MSAPKRKSPGDKAETSPSKRVHANQSFLARHSVEQVFRDRNNKRRVIALNHNMTVAEALDKLAKENITSAPVVISADLEDISEEPSDTFLGMVDSTVLVHKLMEATRSSWQKKEEKASHVDWSHAKECEEDFLKRKLIVVCDGSDVKMMFRAQSDTSLLDLLQEGFVGPDGKYIHRVALFDGGGNITGLVSQSDIVRFLNKRKSFLGDIVQKSVAELDLGNAVVTVKESHTTGDAFALMDEKNLSCIGIVDEHGKLVGNLSASDLKGLKQGHGFFLQAPLSRFTTHLGGYSAVISCRDTATFGDVLSRVTNNGVHRVYVVDNDHKPVKIITLTDLLKCVAH